MVWMEQHVNGVSWSKVIPFEIVIKNGADYEWCLLLGGEASAENRRLLYKLWKATKMLVFHNIGRAIVSLFVLLATKYTKYTICK